MTRHNIHRGDIIRMDDGKKGLVVSAAEDGSVQIKTDSGIIISSVPEEMHLGPPEGAADRP
ncbi:MAG: hypothetical protein KY475_00075 [Planctomycetes bacterium]|nr:hypothetical protein [Planctomycetota bacterium]